MNIFEESSSKPTWNKTYEEISLDDSIEGENIVKKNDLEEKRVVSSIDMELVQGDDQFRIGSFDISKYVVVQSLYEEVMGKEANHSYFHDGDKTKLPVERVSFNDALEFCNKISPEGEKVYSCDPVTGEWSMDKTKTGYRLPTVEEWQYAANGGTLKTPYPYSGSNNVQRVAWYQGDDPTSVHEVGLKEPNELGLFDMSGNVWEWCWKDSNSSWDFCCGGAFNSPDYELRLFGSGSIRRVSSGSVSSNIGFRLVRTQVEDKQ